MALELPACPCRPLKPWALPRAAVSHISPGHHCKTVAVPPHPHGVPLAPASSALPVPAPQFTPAGVPAPPQSTGMAPSCFEFSFKGSIVHEALLGHPSPSMRRQHEVSHKENRIHNRKGPGMVVSACNPSTLGGCGRDLASLSPAWATLQFSKTLSQKRKEERKKEKLLQVKVPGSIFSTKPKKKKKR